MEILQSNSQPREVVISNPKDRASKYIQILVASNVPDEDLQAAIQGVKSSMLAITKQEWHANYGNNSTINADWYLENFHQQGKERFTIDNAILNLNEIIKFMELKYSEEKQKTILLVNNILHDQKMESYIIFGKALLGGSSAIVTVKKFRDDITDSNILFKMIQRLTSHELGHTFWMEHCPEICAMKLSLSVKKAQENTNLQEGKDVYCPLCLIDLNYQKNFRRIPFLERYSEI